MLEIILFHVSLSSSCNQPFAEAVGKTSATSPHLLYTFSLIQIMFRIPLYLNEISQKQQRQCMLYLLLGVEKLVHLFLLLSSHCSKK